MSTAVAPARVPRVPVDPYLNLPADFGDTLNSVAGRVRAMYGGYSLRDDLAQSAWEWIGGHGKAVARWHYEAEVDEVSGQTETRFSYRQCRRDLTRCCVAIARRDRAFALGYNPDDAFPYATAIVKTYLPYVWHSDAMAAFQEHQEKGSTKVDPSRGGNSSVLAMDVRKAYAAIVTEGGSWDRTLFALYGAGMSQVALAEQLGLAQSTVSRHHREAIQALAYQLNGGDELIGPH